MHSVDKIRQYILDLPEGTPFSASALRSFASTDNVRQIITRLVKSGEINRVARGVFVKPKYTSNLGQQLPSAIDVARAITESTGETIAIHGSEAARQLQLTTQVPMRPVFYTDGNTRTLKISNRTVQLKHVNPSKLISPGTIGGLIISALLYLGKDNVTTETVHLIKQRVSSEEFQQAASLVEHMPAWMADLFYKFQQENINE
jgi:hypothetical protein